MLVIKVGIDASPLETRESAKIEYLELDLFLH